MSLETRVDRSAFSKKARFGHPKGALEGAGPRPSDLCRQTGWCASSENIDGLAKP
jgi:hypothetical protein